MRGVIRVRQGTIEEVVALSHRIPEFFRPYDKKVYEDRLKGTPHLILIAEVDDRQVGFKVGYERDLPHVFYSWMGGVLEPYRKMGVATKLAEAQELWASDQGYLKIYFKTRNRLVNMIRFGLNMGFMIVDLVKKDGIEEYRIVMEKVLG
ncbi:GNAT family N-acetyltransferase [Belliella sp. R4-6]|uniref:GNAT family N-acetyltransferase n=1 Tax=Belliella alkalica TaxID=1730871 RepID=A0ABS9VED8_9BACT|nr:GNAT family N-acetyltransferase [Belliella alkalica]MCH7414809.1 GNAT family N-acetyltransferase [Belliella alkalica]